MNIEIYIIPVLLAVSAILLALGEKSEDDTIPTFEDVFGFRDYTTKEERLYA